MPKTAPASAAPASASADARCPGELAATRRELEVLRAFALDMMAIQDADDLRWYVAKNVVGRMGFIDCVVYRYDPEIHALVQAACIGEKNPERDVIVNHLVIPIGKGITGEVARKRTPIRVDDLAADRRYIPDLVEARSELCVPLLHDDKILGVIDCEHPEPDHFTDEHMRTLQSVAALASAQLAQCALLQELTLTRDALAVALEESRAAHRAQSAFIAQISHEFRTPLNAIVGFSSAFLKDGYVHKKPDQVVARAKHIYDAGEHLNAMIDDMISVSTAAAGALTARPERIDLNAAIREVIPLLSAKAGAKNMRIHLTLTPDCTIFGLFDQRHFRQIVINLLDNAVKYGREATNVTVTLRASGERILCAVRDCGPGVDPAEQARIFDAFYREGAAREGGADGLGLGLCICRNLALANGADLALDSAPGEGCVFTLSLPQG